MKTKIRPRTNEYAVLHYRLKKKVGKASKCSNPDCPVISKNFEWALIRGREYSDSPDDYIELCIPCHRKYDTTEETIKKLSKMYKGKICLHTAKKVIHIPTGKVFNRVKDAAKAAGINYTKFIGILRGHFPNNTNFDYYDGAGN